METIDCIEVYGKFPLIETRGVIIDTPGRGAVYDQDYLTQEILPQVDVILCPIAADYPLSSDEAGFLTSLSEQKKKKLQFIVTKIDELDKDECDEVVARIQTIVNKITGGVPQLYQVAAKKVIDTYKAGKSGEEIAAIKARRDCGVKELEDALDKKLRGASIIESRIRICCNALADEAAGHKKRLEESKTELALDSAELESRQKELQEVSGKLKDSYTKHTRELKRAWNKEIERFTGKMERKEAKIIDRLGEAQGNLFDLIGFQKKLGRRIQAILKQEFSEDLTNLNIKLEDTVRKFSQDLDNAIDEEIKIYRKSGSSAAGGLAADLKTRR